MFNTVTIQATTKAHGAAEIGKLSLTLTDGQIPTMPPPSSSSGSTKCSKAPSTRSSRGRQCQSSYGAVSARPIQAPYPPSSRPPLPTYPPLSRSLPTPRILQATRITPQWPSCQTLQLRRTPLTPPTARISRHKHSLAPWRGHQSHHQAGGEQGHQYCSPHTQRHSIDEFKLYLLVKFILRATDRP